MDDRLTLGHELPLGQPHGRHHLSIGGQCRGVVFVGRQHPVATGIHVGLGEHQVFGDPAQLAVGGAGRKALLLLGVHAQRRGSERHRCHVAAHRLGHTVVAESFVESSPPHPMVRQVLHGDQVSLGVISVDVRHQPRCHPGVHRGDLGLQTGPVGPHRPGRADETHVGQGLLEHHSSPCRVGQDEDQVQVAVTDLLHPGQRRGVDQRRQFGARRHVAGRGVGGQHLISDVIGGHRRPLSRWSHPRSRSVVVPRFIGGSRRRRRRRRGSPHRWCATRRHRRGARRCRPHRRW